MPFSLALNFQSMYDSTDIVGHKRARPFPLYAESYCIAESNFFSFHAIQMQNMSYLKVEPRRNVTIHLNHATANYFFHRRRMLQWFSLMGLWQVQQISLNTS